METSILRRKFININRLTRSQDKSLQLWLVNRVFKIKIARCKCIEESRRKSVRPLFGGGQIKTIKPPAQKGKYECGEVSDKSGENYLRRFVIGHT